jgi:hypothetical protein
MVRLTKRAEPPKPIALSLVMDNLRENVVIDILATNDSTRQTAQLLESVYNRGTTDIKEVECAILRNIISVDIARFWQYLRQYNEEPELGFDSLIEKEISRSSAFAAFKRRIIREDAELCLRFADALAS